MDIPFQPKLLEGKLLGSTQIDPIVADQIDARLSNIVIIQSESDFPNQDASTIYGDPHRMYYIVKPFSTAKQFIGDNCAIRGIATSEVFWTYTGTGVAIQNTLTGRVQIDFLHVVAPSGTLFKVVGDSSGNADQRMNITVCTGAAKKIFDIVGAGALIVTLGNFTGDGTVDDLVSFSGSNGVIINFTEVFFLGIPAGGSGLNLGTYTCTQFVLNEVSFFGDATANAIKGLSNSNNILSGGLFRVSGGDYNSFTTPLSGISSDDIRVIFSDVSGVAPSFYAASPYLSNQITVTIDSTNTFVLVDQNSWTSVVANKLSVSSSGRVTNITENAITVSVNGFVTMEKVGGGNNYIEARIVKNGNVSATESVATTNGTQNGQPTSVPLTGIFTLEPNDYIETYVANTDSTSNIIITSAKLSILAKA